MKKKSLFSFILIVTLLFAMPIGTYAHARVDTTPTPSVTITIEGLEDVLCYGTLLSESDSLNSLKVYDGKENTLYPEGTNSHEQWRAFVEYADSDGYHFLQIFWPCNYDNSFSWGQSPTPFKVLLYFPEYDTFAVSGIYETYAFDSNFATSLEGIDLNQADGDILLAVERSYDYNMELISFFSRIIVALLIVLAITLRFGYREKKQLKFIAAVNIVSQIALNVVLSIVNYRSGESMFVMHYILLEMLIFAIEVPLYTRRLQKDSKMYTEKDRAIIYALVANALAFGGGLGIAHIIPGIF